MFEKIKIETYWNVNLFLPCSLPPSMLIKIETYWNVNKCESDVRIHLTLIKIETYWNVNFPVPHASSIALLN